MRRSPSVLLLVLVVALACCCLSVSAGPSGKCRALAMSGGGDKAAYEAGVVRGLLDNVAKGEAAYDVVTGISAGSTLTAALSVFELGQEDEAADMMYSIIANLNQSAIFTEWPGGILDGFFNKSSLFDSTPLRQLFTGILSGHKVSSSRITCMGATNVKSGHFERHCKHASVADVVDATLASAAIPGVFIPISIAGELFIDGGITAYVDVIGAVQQCMALGYPESAIIVDTVECGGLNLTALSGDPATLTVLPMLLRALEIRSFGNQESDYLAAVHAYPGVDFRYHIMPSQPITGSGIDFNSTAMRLMQQMGEQDAKDAVRNGGNRFQTRIALE